jgi:RNA polymerase sigma factor (sigma-70 family)
LGAAEQAAYVGELHHYLPSDPSEQQLRALVLHYHLDHEQVQALLSYQHTQHDDAWRAWLAQAVAILRHAGLAWSDDTAIDVEDLAQITQAELARSLPSFRYGSRFSTWAHQVIVRSVQRHQRDRQARKRAGHPTALEQSHLEELPIRAVDQPDALAHARLLATLVDTILAAQPDPRLAHIFQLWAQVDLRIEEIGQHVRLSPSQVRVLLSRIRDILRHDPRIQDWRGNSFGDRPDDE